MASTCGYDDRGRPRAAQTGYLCTVYAPFRIWGFCPTTVFQPSDCGLAGYCYDDDSCSNGCGMYPTSTGGLTVITCSTSSYCSILVSDNGGDEQYQYIACGASGPPRTIYAAPPTVLASSTSSATVATTSPASKTSVSSPTPTSPAVSSTYSNDSTSPEAVTRTSTPSSTERPENGKDSGTPLAPIIGGVLGGVALLCLTTLAVFWIRRRGGTSGKKSENSPYEAAPPHYEDRPLNMSHTNGYYEPARHKTHEADGTGALYEAEASRDPVELPGR